MPVAYAPAGGQVEVDDRAEEAVGDLDQDPGAVAGVGLGARRAPVVEVADAVSAWSTMSWLLRPCMSTTNRRRTRRARSGGRRARARRAAR